MKKSPQFIIGIDEAGRGPLAGPVAVGAVMSKNWQHSVLGVLPKLKDSKKLSEKQREVWFEFLKQEKKKGNLNFAVSLVSEKIIDRQGIVAAIKIGIKNCLKKLKAKPLIVSVLLDGSLKAPPEFTNQKTIIRGDESEPIISLASIVAKVTRDKHMARVAKKYPGYGFEVHKGYGTKKHYKALKKLGISVIHRRSYL